VSSLTGEVFDPLADQFVAFDDAVDAAPAAAEPAVDGAGDDGLTGFDLPG
jgi:hypothetical protein